MSRILSILDDFNSIRKHFKIATYVQRGKNWQSSLLINLHLTVLLPQESSPLSSRNLSRSVRKIRPRTPLSSPIQPSPLLQSPQSSSPLLQPQSTSPPMQQRTQFQDEEHANSEVQNVVRIHDP